MYFYPAILTLYPFNTPSISVRKFIVYTLNMCQKK